MDTATTLCAPPSNPAPRDPPLVKQLRIDGRIGTRSTPRVCVLCPACSEPVRIWFEDYLPARLLLYTWCPSCRRPFSLSIHAIAATDISKSPPPPGVKVNSGRARRIDRLNQPREERHRLHSHTQRSPMIQGYGLKRLAADREAAASFGWRSGRMSRAAFAESLTHTPDPSCD